MQTVIRAEDKRFYKHNGVDWLALGDAALDNLFSSRTRGASTLSMQVAAMLEASLKARHSAPHGRAEVGPDPGRARSGEEVEQAPDPRGLSQPVDLSRRGAGCGRGGACAVRQACPAGWTKTSR